MTPTHIKKAARFTVLTDFEYFRSWAGLGRVTRCVRGNSAVIRRRICDNYPLAFISLEPYLITRDIALCLSILRRSVCLRDPRQFPARTSQRVNNDGVFHYNMFADPARHYVCYPGGGRRAIYETPANIWRCEFGRSLTTGRLSATVYTTGYGNFSVASFAL